MQVSKRLTTAGTPATQTKKLATGGNYPYPLDRHRQAPMRMSRGRLRSRFSALAFFQPSHFAL